MSVKEERPKELSRTEWETLCKRCGECCFEKWIDGDGTIYPTKEACRHLDMITRECRVYHKRLDVGEGCIRLTPEVVETVQWLPQSCGYVEHLRRGDAPPKISDGKPERRRGRR